MTTHRCLTAFGLLLVIFALIPFVKADDKTASSTRTWTSSSGTVIEAELVSVNDKGDQAVLKTTDGRTLTVPLNKLSAEDQKYLAENAPAAAPKPALGSNNEAISDDQLKALSATLKKALKENPSEKEREKFETTFARLLPAKGADGEELRWKVSMPPAGEPGESGNVLITVDAHPKSSADDDDRLVWMHVVYQAEKPESYGSDKWGRYPVMRMENRHMFVLIGQTEVRAIADAESYENDAKLEALVEGMNLEAIKKL